MSEAARPFPSRSPAARRGDVLQPLAAALIALALGFAVQPVTGTRPDWDLVLRILDKLWTVTLVGAIGLVAGRLIWLALVVRSPRPTRDLVGWLRRLALPDGPLPALATTVGTFFVFAMGVGVLKGAIAVLAPFPGTSRCPGSTGSCTSAGCRMNGWRRSLPGRSPSRR